MLMEFFFGGGGINFNFKKCFWVNKCLVCGDVYFLSKKYF